MSTLPTISGYPVKNHTISPVDPGLESGQYNGD